MSRRERRVEQRADLAFDRVRELRIGRDEDRGGVGAVLGLGQQVQGHAASLGRRRGEDEALGRTRRQVDADLAAHLDLRGGHPCVAGSDDPVDRRQAGIRQAVGEGADRLGATGDDEGIDLEQAGDAEQDGVRDAFAVGGAGDDDALDPGHARRDDGHDQRARVRRRAARDVGADTGQRVPAAFDLDPGRDLGAGRRRSLGLGEAGDVVDGLVEGAASPLVEAVARGAKVGRVGDEAPIGAATTDAGVRVADGGVATLADVGEGLAGRLADRRGRARRRAARGRDDARPPPARRRPPPGGRGAGAGGSTPCGHRVSAGAGVVTGRSSRSGGRGCRMRPRP